MERAIHGPGKGRRLALPLALCCAVAVTAILILAAIRLLDARRHLLAGSQDLRQARDALRTNLIGGGNGPRIVARRAVLRGEAEIRQARSDLHPWAPILVKLGWIPIVGDQLAAAPSITDASWYATRSALGLLDGLAPALAVLNAPHSRQNALTRIGYAVLQGRPGFAAAARDADLAGASLKRIPPHTSNKTLATASRELRQTVPMLLSAGRWLSAVPDVLGFRGPSRYLILLQNPANIAPTGGMIGAADFLTLDRGSARSDFSSSALPHQIESVSAPLPEELYSPIGYWTLLDSNWSPDFPLSARIARWFYGEDTGRWSEGVVGLLDTGIVRILAGTGPVYVPAYGRWVDAGDVESLSQQYVNGTYHGPSGSGAPDTVRKQFLGDVIHALVDRLQSLPASRWPAVGQAVQDAVTTRELQLYDRRSGVESAISTSGADGGLRAAAGDFLSVVDFNESDNKLNPYVGEWARYRVVVGPDLRIDATLSIHYHVAPSPANLEGVGPVFGYGGTKHDYEDFVRVYVPYGSELFQVSGLQPWAPETAYDLTQFGGRLLVREGQSRTVTFRYRIPANALAGSGFTGYALTVRHQPGANLTSVRVIVGGRGGVTVGSGSNTSLARTVRVDRDARLRVALRGPLHPQVVPLSRASGPIDPYIPFADLRDPTHPY